MRNIQNIIISPNTSIRKSMEVIDKGEVKIALIVENDKFLGTLNDGDIRRSILKGLSLDDPIEHAYCKNSVTANFGIKKQLLIDICSENKIKHIPILDYGNRVVDLFVFDETLKEEIYPNKVVLMVGGQGKRLRPLTEKLPKPMLKVGDEPLLRTIIDGFAKYGFLNFVMCLGYKADSIKDYFGDGSKFGVSIEYVIEDKPLGTAGGLKLASSKLKEPFFVMNGDLLTNVNFEKLYDFHYSSKSVATMCVRQYEIEIPYGVVNTNKDEIISIEEKPSQSLFVSAGIYMLKPDCLNFIPENTFFDMPNLFDELIKQETKVTAFPLPEYWIDIGNIDKYHLANKDFKRIFNV